MKNLVCIDIETTGLDKKNNHIIQLSAVKINSETFEEIDSFKSYIKPLKDFTIEDGAFEKHGLSKVFILEQGKTIKEIGQDFIDFIEDCDILSYNGMSFDIAFIDKDFSEAGISIDWSKHKSIDVYSIECTLNSRRLEDVYKKYTGNDLINAHDALSDVRATIEVYKHQKNILAKAYLFIQTVPIFGKNRGIDASSRNGVSLKSKLLREGAYYWYQENSDMVDFENVSVTNGSTKQTYKMSYKKPRPNETLIAQYKNKFIPL